MTAQAGIDEGVVRQFWTDGAVVLRGLLSSEWIEILRGAVPELLDGSYDPLARMQYKNGPDESPILQSSGKWSESGSFRRFLVGSPIAAASAAVLGSESVRLYEDLFQLRPPGLGEPGWHRDMPYWPMTGRQATNVWFTLEEVSPYSGGIHIVAGSHLDSDEEVKTLRQPDGKRHVLAFGTEPGDVVIFHPWALHTGFGSSAERPRRTFTIRFLGEDVRWRPTRGYYHDWMAATGLSEGDPLDHPGFPVMWPAAVATSGASGAS
jgi:hypothetical protein